MRAGPTTSIPMTWAIMTRCVDAPEVEIGTTITTAPAPPVTAYDQRGRSPSRSLRRRTYPLIVPTAIAIPSNTSLLLSAGRCVWVPAEWVCGRFSPAFTSSTASSAAPASSTTASAACLISAGGADAGGSAEMVPVLIGHPMREIISACAASMIALMPAASVSPAGGRIRAAIPSGAVASATVRRWLKVSNPAFPV